MPPTADPDAGILRSLDALVAYASALPDGAVLGIAGAPGAGKSTVAASLVERMPGAALLPMDGFHLPQARLVALGRRERMGAPDTFDVDGFVGLLRDVRSGQPVEAPGFDRVVEEAVPGALPIAPGFRILVVEGNYLLLEADGWGAVRPLLDAAVFVALDDDVRHARLIARHERFGKSADAARAWALGPDEANARLIAATAARADRVLRLD